jgi:hypothetical protein
MIIFNWLIFSYKIIFEKDMNETNINFKNIFSVIFLIIFIIFVIYVKQSLVVEDNITVSIPKDKHEKYFEKEKEKPETILKINFEKECKDLKNDLINNWEAKSIHDLWNELNCIDYICSKTNTKCVEMNKIECLSMKTKYKVVPGQSWGSITQELIERWKIIRCDQFFCKPDDKEGKGTYNCIPL